MKYLITTLIMILAMLLLASLVDVHAETIVLKFTVTTSSSKHFSARSVRGTGRTAPSSQAEVKKQAPSVLPVKKYLTQDAESTRQYVLNYVSRYYNDAELVAFDNLIKSESGWRMNAVNPSSGACGLGQSLPCEKMGCSLGDVDCQTQWIVGYVNRRYGSPLSAWNFHLENNWY